MKHIFNILPALLILLTGCSSQHFFDKAINANYMLIENKDTLVYEKIFLNPSQKKQAVINKQQHTIHVFTDYTTRLVTVTKLKEMYKRDSVDIAVVIFKGEILNKDPDKVFIQHSLIKDAEIIKSENISKAHLFHHPNADILLLY